MKESDRSTKITARLRRNRNSEYLPQRSENNGEKFLQDNSSLPSELGVLCALAGVNSLNLNIPDTGTFAQAAQTFEHSGTKDTKGSDN